MHARRETIQNKVGGWGGAQTPTQKVVILLAPKFHSENRSMPLAVSPVQLLVTSASGDGCGVVITVE